MHLLHWIQGALSLQKIHNHLMDPSSNFQKNMVQYLKSVHQGEFINDLMENVAATAISSKECSEYINPTFTLPLSPPDQNC